MMQAFSSRFIRTMLLVMLAAFLAVIVRTLYARVLTPERYGLLFSLQALVLFLTPFLNLGTGEAMNYFLPREREWKSYVSTALLVTLLTSFFGMLAFIIFAHFIARAYLHDVSLAWIVRLFSIGLLAWPVFLVLRNALRARGFPEAYQLGDVLVAFTRLAFVRLPYERLILVWNVFPLFFTTLYAFLARSFFGRPSFRILRTLFAYSLPNMLSAVIIMLLTQIDIIMLTFLAPLQSVGVYAANLPYLTFALFLLQPVIILYYPLLAPLSGRPFRREAQRGFFLTLFLLTLTSAVAFPFLPLALNLLLPAAYQPSILLISILLIASIFAGISRFILILLSAEGNVQARLSWSLGMILLNILVNALFIPRFLATGAAVGTLLASILPFFLTQRYALLSPLRLGLFLFFLLLAIPLSLVSPFLASLSMLIALLPFSREAYSFAISIFLRGRRRA